MRLQESAMELPTFNREVPSLNDEAKRVSDEAPSLSVKCLSLTREAPSVSVDSPRVSVEAKRVTDEVKRVIVDSQRLNCQARNINIYSQLGINRLFLTMPEANRPPDQPIVDYGHCLLRMDAAGGGEGKLFCGTLTQRSRCRVNAGLDDRIPLGFFAPVLKKIPLRRRRQAQRRIQRRQFRQLFPARAAAELLQFFARRFDARFVAAHGLVERPVRRLQSAPDFFQMLRELDDSHEQFLRRFTDFLRVLRLRVLLPAHAHRTQQRDERRRCCQQNPFLR